MDDFSLLSQLVWMALYLLGTALVGSAAVCILLRAGNSLGFGRKTCFFWGFAGIPFIIGIYMLLMSLIPIRLSQYFYLFGLYVICAAIVLRDRGTIWELRAELHGDSESEHYWCLGIISAVLITESCFWEQIYYLIHRSLPFFIFFSVAGLALSGVLMGFLRIGKIRKIYFCIFFLGYICLYLSKYFSDQRMRMLDSGMADRIMVFVQLFAFLCILSFLILWLLYGKCKSAYWLHPNPGIRLLPVLFVILTGCLTMHAIYVTRILKRNLIDLALLAAGLVVSGIYLKKRKGNLLCRDVIQAISIVTILYFCTIILRSGLVPVTGQDAIEYLSNALKFTESMNFSGINHFNGVADGSLLAIIHHPGWVLYLAYGLLFTSPGQFGYPCDFVARFSIQSNLIYMMFACIGFLQILKRKRGVSAGTILFFFYTGLAVIFSSHTRDAYRIIPMIFLAGILVSIGRLLKQEQRPSTSACWLSGLVCMCVMMGHPINAIESLAIVAAFFVWLLCSRLFRKEVFVWGLGCILGAMLGCYQIIWAFISTGRASGIKIDIDRLLEGTDYYANYMRYTEGRLGGADTYLERLLRLLGQDHGILVITSVVAAIFAICYLIKKRNVKSSIFYFSLLILFQSLVYVDLLGWSGIRFTEWCVMNTRYTLQMYVFYGLYLGIIVDQLQDKPMRGQKWISCFLILICMIPVLLLNIKWEGKKVFEASCDFIAEYDAARALIKERSPEKILIDNYYCNYYLDDRGVTFFSDSAEQIRKASDQEALYRELKEEGYGMILITDSLRNVYWKDTLLEKLTESPDYISDTLEQEYFKVYVLR